MSVHRTEAEELLCRLRNGTESQRYACSLVVAALALAGVEVRHVIPSLHIDGGIKMCFREQRDDNRWRVFGWEGDAHSVVTLLSALVRCASPNDVEQALCKAREV
jgi:hypothetical protein